MNDTAPLLSVLDATPVGPGITARDALRSTSEVARAAERLGYIRFWVVEHHGARDIGCGVPAVLIAHLAAITKTLRLGSGGVMLPNHTPYIVAEQFSMLQSLHPGRIDLGVGRASGTDPSMAIALQRRAAHPEDFEKQLDDLTGFLCGTFPAGHPFQKVRLSLAVAPPPVFLLGSSESSARVAAARGLPFAFAHHLNPTATRNALATYRAAFQPRGKWVEPYAISTVAVTCAPSEDEARHIAASAAIVRLRRSLATQHGLDVSDEAIRYPRFSAEERQIASKQLSGGWIIVGGPDRVLSGLMQLRRDTGADELMLTTIEYDEFSRIGTLESVRKASPDLARQMAAHHAYA